MPLPGIIPGPCTQLSLFVLPVLSWCVFALLLSLPLGGALCSSAGECLVPLLSEEVGVVGATYGCCFASASFSLRRCQVWNMSPLVQLTHPLLQRCTTNARSAELFGRHRAKPLLSTKASVYRTEISRGKPGPRHLAAFGPLPLRIVRVLARVLLGLRLVVVSGCFAGTAEEWAMAYAEFNHWLDTRGQNIDVALVTETHWKLEMDPCTWSLPNWHCIHFASTQRKTAGMLLYVSKRVVSDSNIRFSSHLSGRLAHVRLYTHTPVDLILCYQHASNTKAEAETIRKRAHFWHKLASLLSSIPWRHLLLVLGDFNTPLAETSTAIHGPCVPEASILLLRM